MLKRKASASSKASNSRPSGATKKTEAKPAAARRRFVVSSKAKRESSKPAETSSKAKSAASGTTSQKTPANGQPTAPVATTPNSTVDLTETIKTLVHLGQEHGYVTYDDINDVLPDNLSPDDLDALLSKLRSLDVEIVMDQAEAERADRTKQPQQAEEAEDDSRLEILDDPVRMYMNQMGKVPLLTREQEVEICKKIEEAEVAMKGIIYGLGFTAKEHIAIAEKLLSEPPKERFDRVIVDKKVANREGHLKDLRKFIKKLRAFDQKVDEKYFAWQKAQQKSRKEELHRELKKLSTKLQEMFIKFYYKQKVVEEMIV
ncbi:MAG: RNA polymerase sigma factor region1.1 domain-containing protein, partial [Verrucomicrobiota bacterium]